MLEAISSIFSLRWTNPPTFHPLPDNVTRTFISTPSRPHHKLELLASDLPAAQSQSTPPILFIHGGFGSASVWLPFISRLSSTTRCYAISTRNHGASYSVSYPVMVWFTTMSDLCNDIVAAITHINATTGQAPVLVAHSSGGGLAQNILAKKLAGPNLNVPGLVLLDAVPHFGNLSVYANWAKHDPWFGLRTMVHASHPISPLSSVELVRGAFFGPSNNEKPALSDGEVKEFVKWMPRYESLTWPMQMGGSFWGWLTGRPKWLNVQDVLGSVRLDGTTDKVCVMVGDKDVLMDVGMCRKAAQEYRDGIEELRERKKVDTTDATTGSSAIKPVDDGSHVESNGCVRFVVVKGAGHHAQNDVQWEVAAEELKRFVAQI